MPESVDDRPTKSHEYVFLLSKNADYFYDSVAVLEKANYDGRQDTFHKGSEKYKNGYSPTDMTPNTCSVVGHERWPSVLDDGSYGRNQRTVWDITTQSFPDAHFAVFPPELPRRCIKAGTSEYGACPKCGAPWERIVDTKSNIDPEERVEAQKRAKKQGIQSHRAGSGLHAYAPTTTTTGWKPTCNCYKHAVEEGDKEVSEKYFRTHPEEMEMWRRLFEREVVPCVVLDPFGGSGTTGEVARELNRDAILIDLNPEYIKIMKRRLRLNEQLVGE